MLLAIKQLSMAPAEKKKRMYSKKSSKKGQNKSFHLTLGKSQRRLIFLKHPRYKKSFK